MRYSDLVDGQVVTVDGGFDCMTAGTKVVHHDDHGFYVECDHGHHYLDGQVDDDSDEMVGVAQ